MNAGKPARSSNRIERLARAMLGIALMVAVVWAITGGNALSHPLLGSL